MSRPTLVLVHFLVLYFEVIIFVLVLVLFHRVLFGGLREVDHLAAGALAKNVFGIDLLQTVLFLLCCWIGSDRNSIVLSVRQPVETYRPHLPSRRNH